VVLIDGSIGQMMEAVEMPPMLELRKDYPNWAVRGGFGDDKRTLSSIYFDPPDEEKANLRLMRRWQEIEKNEVRFKEYYMDDAKLAVMGFGSAGRIGLSAVRAARAAGLPVGLLRPISLSPFPYEAVRQAAEQVDNLLVVEMNSGMMLEDVLKEAKGRTNVEFFGRMGGMIPFPDEILTEIKRMLAEKTHSDVHPRDQWLKRMEVIA
jgi:2-oxoglutarate ferredoxin oxidoreductase subunit alpha